MELRYITQENIEQCHINVTSAEMYSEAREYNILMHDMRLLKVRSIAEFFGVIIVNIIFLIGISLASSNLGLIMMMKESSISPLNAVRFVIIAAYAALFIFLVAVKKIFSYKLLIALTAPLLLCDWRFVFLLAMNTAAFYFLDKNTQTLRDAPGYPGFAELRITYIRDDDNDKAESPEEMFSFEKLASDVHDMEEL